MFSILVLSKTDIEDRVLQKCGRKDIFVHNEKKIFLAYEKNDFFDQIGMALLRCYVENNNNFCIPNPQKFFSIPKQVAYVSDSFNDI